MTNAATLVSAEEMYAQLLASNAEDIQAAQAVEALIRAIGTPITQESEAAITAARLAYNALTDAQKQLVSNYSVLTAAEQAFANLQKSGYDTIAIVLPADRTFSDVPNNAYYAHAVQWAVENGITTGTSATTFSPNAACTRAQAVTFLWLAAGSPMPRITTTTFSDVKSSAYYYYAVLWAVEQGITLGTSDTKFSPNQTCTRAQIVTFLWRSADAPSANTANPFKDASANAFYTEAVLWAVENEITSGTSATTFSPQADCTRAQIVTFLYRCFAG